MKKWMARAAGLVVFGLVMPVAADDSVISVFGSGPDDEVTVEVRETDEPAAAAVESTVPARPDPAKPQGMQLVAPSPDAVLLDQVSREINQVGGQVRLLELQVQKRGLEERLGNTTSSGTPELIGIYGSSAALRAEFRVGRAVLVAKAGEWVTDRWRVVRVMTNGAVLTDGTKQQTVLFGRGTNPVGAAASPGAGPGPGARAPYVEPYVAPDGAQGVGDD